MRRELEPAVDEPLAHARERGTQLARRGRRAARRTAGRRAPAAWIDLARRDLRAEECAHALARGAAGARARAAGSRALATASSSTRASCSGASTGSPARALRLGDERRQLETLADRREERGQRRRGGGRRLRRRATRRGAAASVPSASRSASQRSRLAARSARAGRTQNAFTSRVSGPSDAAPRHLAAPRAGPRRRRSARRRPRPPRGAAAARRCPAPRRSAPRGKRARATRSRWPPSFTAMRAAARLASVREAARGRAPGAKLALSTTGRVKMPRTDALRAHGDRRRPRRRSGRRASPRGSSGQRKRTDSTSWPRSFANARTSSTSRPRTCSATNGALAVSNDREGRVVAARSHAQRLGPCGKNPADEAAETRREAGARGDAV